jgi:O-methyltransferase involved in polyketide biosynthesis
VTRYLTEAGVVATLEFLSKVARDSRLAFTYVRKDFLDGRAMYSQKDACRRFVASGIWLFAMEPDAVETFLNRYSWHVTEHVGYDEFATRGPTRRTLASTPIERVVYAESNDQAACGMPMGRCSNPRGTLPTTTVFFRRALLL